MDFVFPPDRFPKLFPLSVGGVSVPEQFGGPLVFDPLPLSIATVGRYQYYPDHQFKPNAENVETKRMKVMYNITHDRYIRSGAPEVRGWSNAVWRKHNVDRKEEDLDLTRMVYLARTHRDNNDRHGLVEWRFNLKESSKIYSFCNRDILLDWYWNSGDSFFLNELVKQCVSRHFR